MSIKRKLAIFFSIIVSAILILNNATKEKGTGLGLMITGKIIAEHQGEMNITSQPGEGTTVEILLPTQLDSNH
jgi:signal transduction histidine kinase